jgi:hypothetical protein
MAQQMETRKARQATPERWQRALQRALFAGVEAKQGASSGEWMVSSASRPGIAYKTDGVSCDCEAAMLSGNPVCLHHAAYWYAQGVLERDPEPQPPASAAPVVCFRCRGTEAECPFYKGAGSAIVHNGIVENHHCLREELRARGHDFRSETDSEAITTCSRRSCPRARVT